jgi:hypothetical protein
MSVSRNWRITPGHLRRSPPVRLPRRRLTGDTSYAGVSQFGGVWLAVKVSGGLTG